MEDFHSWNQTFGLDLDEQNFGSCAAVFPSEPVVSSGVSGSESSGGFELDPDTSPQRLRGEDRSPSEHEASHSARCSLIGGPKTPPLFPERSFACAQLHSDVTAALLNVECKVCGDRASGFHYGVYACEGCKGFFRRTARLNLRYKDCSRNCRIQKKSRNRCQSCRFRKCVLVGMSHSAIRFGRTPLAEREKMIKEFHTHTLQLEPESERRREICRNLYESYIKHFPMTRNKSRAVLSGKDPKHTVFVIYDMKSLVVGEEMLRQKQSCVSGVFPCAELELSVFRRVTYGSAESVRRLTLFAKSIPGFVELEPSDQITMLKYSALEVNIIRLSHMTNQDGVLLGDSCVFMTREFLKSLRKPFCDIIEIKYEFLSKFRALELEDCDLALFITALILCEDRPGLLNPKAIEVLQDDVLQALELQLKILHPDAPHLFAKLLHKMTDLRPLVAEHIRNIHLLKQNELDLCLHPLLLEIMQDLY